MRLKAYLLAADPAWIEASVLSYYDQVEEIVVSYDEDGISWTGSPIAVEECLNRLRKIDRAGKMTYAPGHYARLDHEPLENDTFQRQAALDQASEGADWVLQLDTDEVIGDPGVFAEALRRADEGGFHAMEYPSRNILQHVDGDRYLEWCRRFWRIAGYYPGPVAIRAGSSLRLCRQADVSLFRVDFAARNTDPRHHPRTPVHMKIEPRAGIAHYSWVRSDEHMRAKSQSSGHSREFDWGRALRWWEWCRRHPYFSVVGSPLLELEIRRNYPWLRLARIEDPTGLGRDGTGHPAGPEHSSRL